MDLRWALGQVSLQNHRHAGHLANVLDEVAALLAQGEQIKVLVLVGRRVLNAAVTLATLGREAVA